MDRKDFLALPIEERRKLIEEQASDPKIQEYYRQLFEPKPDHTPECKRHKAIFGGVGCTCKPSGSLLTPEEIFKIPPDEYFQENVLKAQRDPTASIKDAEKAELEKGVEALLVLKDEECQARIEALIEQKDAEYRKLKESAIGINKHRVELLEELRSTDTVCQARIEALIDWGGQHCTEHHTRMNNVLHRTCNECWQALKPTQKGGK